jgi:hypothetical protein
MPHHWDFAWSKARGQFVIINCDDDALSESGLDTIDRAIQKFDADIVSWPVALYLHPDYAAEGGPNLLLFPAGHSTLLLSLDARELIAKFANFEFHFFPSGTHFCLSKELGDKVFSSTGRLFWPPAPDFTAPLLALAANRGKYCYIDAVLGFGGRSKNSNAASLNTDAKADYAKRAIEFRSEFGREDMYPFHSLKVSFYDNNFLAAMSLMHKFYPEVSNVKADLRRFFNSAYEELFGIRPNPLVDKKSEEQLNIYIESLDSDAHALASQARADALQRKHRRMPRSRAEVIRTITPAFAKAMIEQALTSLGLYRRTAAVIRLRGIESGFKDGFELISQWDHIVRQNDLTSLANVNQAFQSGLLLSAYALERSDKEVLPRHTD